MINIPLDRNPKLLKYRPIEWNNGCLVLLDQRQIPHAEVYLTLQTAEGVVTAIQEMVVRGAPAIGIAAAYGMVLAAQKAAEGVDFNFSNLEEAARKLIASRPTAVNLAWAVNQILEVARTLVGHDLNTLQAGVLKAAHEIAARESANNLQIGLNALPLWGEKVTFIHHCNTGALATGEYGTALGVIRAAHENGKKVFVFVDETRPRLQGSRLTAWELERLGIPYKIIVDGASGQVMRCCGVDAVTVGCDRVAANGDTANKIGTYNLAIAARAHNIPFYVVGPTSTVDLNTPDGDSIPIEERAEEEITRLGKTSISPENAPAYNPAFDVTPADFITAIITEQGIAYPPFEQSLRDMVAKAKLSFSA